MLRDIHHALRLLGESPGFTMVAVLTLGIGIGANITIFSMINAVLRPLAAPQSEKLVRLYETDERPLAKGSVSAPFFSIGVSEPAALKVWERTRPGILHSTGDPVRSGCRVRRKLCSPGRLIGIR